jgi:uncharacterized protein
VNVTRLADAEAFLAGCQAFLLEREAEHNVMLGVAGHLRHAPDAYGTTPYFGVVEHGGRTVGAAVRTPPFPALLSESGGERVPALLADDLHLVFEDLPGVVGSKQAAAAFARRWSELTGAERKVTVAERLFRTDAVVPPAGVSGRLRPYAHGDRELLIDWLTAFEAEALPEGAPTGDAAAALRRRLDEPGGGFVLWDDGEPVAFAGFGGRTPNGARIGPVYTPPSRRRCGYASALVAELTRRLLADGRRFCVLYTDLSNPTSNGIYQRVGYEPVADFDWWAFGGR